MKNVSKRSFLWSVYGKIRTRKTPNLFMLGETQTIAVVKFFLFTNYVAILKSIQSSEKTQISSVLHFSYNQKYK